MHRMRIPWSTNAWILNYNYNLLFLSFELIGRRIRAITLEERFDLYIYAHVELLLAQTNSNRPCLFNGVQCSLRCTA